MAQIKFTDRTIYSLKSNIVRMDYWDDSLPGFGLRITPNGDKTFCVKYRIAGKQRRFTLGRYPAIGLATAREMARDAFELVRKGTDPALAKREAEQATFEQERKALEQERLLREYEQNIFKRLSHDYLEQYAKPKKRSWKTDEWYIEKVLNPEFGNRPLADIKRREIRELLDRLVAEGTEIKANRVLACARKIWNWGISKDRAESNPCHGISRPGEERQRDRVLSEDEIKTIWKALDDEKLLMAATFRLRLLTAQRGAEVHALRWKDIDGEWWTIPAEFSKNRLSHRVPLSPQAMRILEQVRKITEEQDKKFGRQPSEWVFPNPIRRKDHISECQKLARRVRTESQIDFKAHDFRRTAASMMAKMGVPRLVIGKILNHIEPGVTKVYDRYSYDREKQEALDAWGARVSRIVSGLELVKTELSGG
ncbi:MAG: tyrosine-type recombinase/integrase [Acidobacteria bacterium]|nr:tyrosine-type recombinase/integrase [Acidobacteriota bacterium]